MIESKKFVDDIKNLFKGNSVDPEKIWQGMEGSDSEQNVAYYCWQIFDYLVANDKKQTIKQNQEKLLSTLLVLEVYKNKKMKKKETVQKIKQLIDKPDIIGHNKWVLEIFLNMYRQEEFIESLISRWTMSPFKINWNLQPGQQIVDEIYSMPIRQPAYTKSDKHYLVLKQLCFPKKIYESKSITFSYVCFMDYIRDHDNVIPLRMYEHVRDIFKAQIHALKYYQDTKTYLFITTQILQSMLTFYGCQFQEILKDLMFWANNLRNFPESLGELGQEIFSLIHNQLKSSGSTFRKKLRLDFPSLDMKQSQNLNKQVYLVTSKSDFLSRPAHCSLLTLRKLIIMHILKISGLNNEEMQSSYKLVQSMNSNLTYNLYFKLMKITDVTSTLEVYQKIKKIQKQSVMELMKIVRQDCEAQKKQATILEIEDFSHLYNDRNPMNIFQYPAYEIVHIQTEQFINKKSEYSFFEIAKRNKEQFPKLNFYRNKIPIVFYGDGYEFSSLLRILSDYFQNVNIEQARNVKIFYIPTPEAYYKNGISIYLSEKDILYKRFVFNAFREKMLFPYVQIHEKNKELFPSYLINKVFHMFLRQAKRTMNVQVYKCYFWFIQSDKRQQYTYFCSNVLIGTSAEAEILKMIKEKDKIKEQKYSNIEYIEILTEKLKKITPVMINTKINSFNKVTKKIEQKIEKNLKVEDLQILNFPKNYFMGNKPDPTSPYLQMSMLVDNYGKIFRRQIINKDNFKKIGDSEIVQAFKDLFISLTIESIQISCVKQPLKILIDGHVVNQVEKMRIQPAISKNGLPIVMPLQCFLPIQ